MFYKNLQWTVTNISASEILFVRWNFNGHIGKNADGYEGGHGDRGFGRRNLEVQRILELLSPTTWLFQIHFSRKGRVL